jgi:hypothetical protein
MILYPFSVRFNLRKTSIPESSGDMVLPSVNVRFKLKKAFVAKPGNKFALHGYGEKSGTVKYRKQKIRVEGSGVVMYRTLKVEKEPPKF